MQRNRDVKLLNHSQSGQPFLVMELENSIYVN